MSIVSLHTQIKTKRKHMYELDYLELRAIVINIFKLSGK